MTGKGFIKCNYLKMNNDELKRYFPDKELEPKDRYSRLSGTCLFSKI